MEHVARIACLTAIEEGAVGIAGIIEALDLRQLDAFVAGEQAARQRDTPRECRGEDDSDRGEAHAARRAGGAPRERT